MSKYAVITNPQNLVLKHEVWFKGEADVQDSRGYLVRAEVCKKVKAFMSEEAAKGFIQYQIDVAGFKNEILNNEKRNG